MEDCQAPALHTEVPVKGDPGDSNGYLCFSPEKDVLYLARIRLPYAFSLAVVSSNGLATAARYRLAANGADLPLLDWVDLPVALEVAAHHTLELELNATTYGAVLTLQAVKLLPTS